jgi:hypothetical protein
VVGIDLLPKDHAYFQDLLNTISFATTVSVIIKAKK